MVLTLDNDNSQQGSVSGLYVGVSHQQHGHFNRQSDGNICTNQLCQHAEKDEAMGTNCSDVATRYSCHGSLYNSTSSVSYSYMQVP